MSTTTKASSTAASPEVTTKIEKLSAERLEASSTHHTRVVFNVRVNIDELERKSNSLALKFEVKLETEPSIARLSVEGVANVLGNPPQIEKMMTEDPSTKVPRVLTPIYQEVYPALFMMVSTLGLPYPSPALLKKAHIAPA